MSRQWQMPKIVNVEAVARSRLFTIESVELVFSNGVKRIYERMHSFGHEAVMIVPVIDEYIILIQEYVVALESYELGFPKGLIEEGETVFEAANRELKEEIGLGAGKLHELCQLTLAPSYLPGKMNVVVAEWLYPERLDGDEPEPLPQVRWPVSNLLGLLQEPDFKEARNISALFMLREWLQNRDELKA